MKKPLSLLLLLVLILSMIPAASAADVVTGTVYSTDILAVVDGHPIPSYNIGGYTCIVMEDLQYYGFKVTWDPEAATISAVSAARPTNYAVYAETQRGVGGSIAGYVYETNIRAFINGLPVESYNIGGYTCVCIETIGDLTDSPNKEYGFSKYLMKAVWDPENKIIALNTFRCQADTQNPILNAGLQYSVRFENEAEFGKLRISHSYRSSSLGKIKKVIPLYLETESGVMTDIIAAYASPYGVMIVEKNIKDLLADMAEEEANRRENPEDMADEAVLESGFETRSYFVTPDGVILFGVYEPEPNSFIYSLRMFTLAGEELDILGLVEEIDILEYLYPVDNVYLDEGKTNLFFTITYPYGDIEYTFDLETFELGMNR